MVGLSVRARACRRASTRLSCSALIRSEAASGSEPKNQSWFPTPKSRAQARNRLTASASSPASARRAALNSRTVSSIRNRTPDGVSATVSSD